MGNESSKTNPLQGKDPFYKAALQKSFDLYATKLDTISLSFLSKRLAKAIRQTANQQPIHFEQWISLFFLLTSNRIDEKAVLFKVFTREAAAKEFIQDLAIAINSFTPSSKLVKITSPTSKFVQFLLDSCSKASYYDDEVKTVDYNDFMDWFPVNHYAQRLFDMMCFKLWLDLDPLSSIPPSFTLQKLPTLFGPRSELLTVEDFFILDTSMDPSSRSKSGWKCAFSSKTNGNSWTVFQMAIESTGSLVLLIRAKDGSVFGAFIATELVPNPKFIDSSRNFIFSIQPVKKVYSSTGVNKNHQYFNYRTSTFPNGLGFGGQFDYFGLWIDESFTKGHSKGSPVSSTFGNPPLATREEFEIDFVEVWCVNEKERDDRFIDAKMSALEQNPEAMELLEMSGKKMWTKELSDQKSDDN